MKSGFSSLPAQTRAQLGRRGGDGTVLLDEGQHFAIRQQRERISRNSPLAR
jgi:hypothetical protein